MLESSPVQVCVVRECCQMTVSDDKVKIVISWKSVVWLLGNEHTMETGFPDFATKHRGYAVKFEFHINNK